MYYALIDLVIVSFVFFVFFISIKRSKKAEPSEEYEETLQETEIYRVEVFGNVENNEEYAHGETLVESGEGNYARGRWQQRNTGHQHDYSYQGYYSGGDYYAYGTPQYWQRREEYSSTYGEFSQSRDAILRPGPPPRGAQMSGEQYPSSGYPAEAMRQNYWAHYQGQSGYTAPWPTYSPHYEVHRRGMGREEQQLVRSWQNFGEPQGGRRRPPGGGVLRLGDTEGGERRMSIAKSILLFVFGIIFALLSYPVAWYASVLIGYILVAVAVVIGAYLIARRNGAKMPLILGIVLSLFGLLMIAGITSAYMAAIALKGTAEAFAQAVENATKFKSVSGFKSVTAGNWRFTVVDVRESASTSGKTITVVIRVENLGDTTESTSVIWGFILITDAGKSYEGWRSGMTRNVAPKSAVEESIVFTNIPAAEVPLRLHFRVGIVGGYEVDIRLK